eukprot:scaffold51279_cov20-Tisochrysis_lutea.AAC.2
MAGMGHASRSRGSKMLLEGVRSMGQEMGPAQDEEGTLIRSKHPCKNEPGLNSMEAERSSLHLNKDTALNIQTSPLAHTEGNPGITAARMRPENQGFPIQKIWQPLKMLVHGNTSEQAHAVALSAVYNCVVLSVGGPDPSNVDCFAALAP